MLEMIDLTRVLLLAPDFFMERTTNGSAFPIRSCIGISSADITVTESTPLTMTSFLLRDDAFTSSVASFLSTFSNEVIDEAVKGFTAFPAPKGTYSSSR